MRFFFLLIVWMCFSLRVFAQEQLNDSIIIRKIYNEALKNPHGYQWLDYLTNRIGGRLAGSPEAAAAVEFTRQVMDTLGLHKVFLQEVMVPHWIRGDQEIGKIINSNVIGSQEVPICALGNSVGTGTSGLSAQVVEVKSLDELEKLGKKNISGKIVFFNRPMDPTSISTFAAYGGAVDQRFSGPSEAAKYGAVGVVVRSMASNIDDQPHTGSLGYQLNVPQIPAVAISTRGAELLSQLLKDDPDLKFYFRTTCRMLPDVLSYNVVGEIKGTQYPEEIIVVGGHLDSWDNGKGAHDDGAGCVQSIDVLRIFKALGIQPKRTIRAVMYMNEENGLRGGRKYAELAEENQEKHIFAIESDAGGFTPQSLGVDNDQGKLKTVLNWQRLFDPYGIQLISGGGGADISPLKNQNVTLASLIPDSQRYFDYHHTAIDTFDKINLRELQLGAAAMTALIYLISEYGL